MQMRDEAFSFSSTSILFIGQFKYARLEFVSFVFLLDDDVETRRPDGFDFIRKIDKYDVSVRFSSLHEFT